MRLFVSAGEPSGDLHGANLIRALRQRQPNLQVHGLGGVRMAAAGCDVIYPLCDHAVVGIVRVFGSVPHFMRILRMADQCLREQKPDAVVMIDFPGFHWWLARRARAHGIPVLYFVPPQLWAWASWRVAKMRQLVQQVLCTLPFEEAWFRRHNVPAEYIGHPYFDELRDQRLDAAFLAEQRRQAGPIVAILPGSRGQELHYNLPSLLRAASLIHQRRPDVRFLVACLHEEHRRRVLAQVRNAGLNLPLTVEAGRTPEIIELAHSCLSVSGSVSLELLYRGKPSVVLYQHHWFGIWAAGWLKHCRYISLVNLLADQELFPEYFAYRCQSESLAQHVLHWLEDAAAYDTLRTELAKLRQRVAEPGACDRAAAHILERTRKKRMKDE